MYWDGGRGPRLLNQYGWSIARGPHISLSGYAEAALRIDAHMQSCHGVVCHTVPYMLLAE